MAVTVPIYSIFAWANSVLLSFATNTSLSFAFTSQQQDTWLRFYNQFELNQECQRVMNNNTTNNNNSDISNNNNNKKNRKCRRRKKANNNNNNNNKMNHNHKYKALQRPTASWLCDNINLLQCLQWMASRPSVLRVGSRCARYSYCGTDYDVLCMILHPSISIVRLG